ncbi:MAG: glycosyltransferase family 1 protein, partial [Bacteroidota bacterium]
LLILNVGKLPNAWITPCRLVALNFSQSCIFPADMSKRVGINTRLLIPHKLDGIGRFTLEIVQRLVLLCPDTEFHLFFDRNPPSLNWPDNVKCHRVWPPARRTYLFDWWFNRSLPRQFRKHKIDLFFSPDGYCSLSTNVPQVSVIHDLNFEHHPEWLPPKIASYLKDRFPKFADKSSEVITVSEYSKDDIVSLYGVPKEQVHVVYNAPSKSFFEVENDQQEEIRKEYGQERPYFLYVGTFHPRKNMEGLVRAFQNYVDQGGGMDLVLVGESLWGNDPWMTQIPSEVQDRIHLKGRLAQSDLTKITAAATCLCYVPFFEGFGLPIVEAFQAGVPVIASNTTSIPEVVEDAGLLVDPRDENQIAGAMIRLENDDILREELIEKGKKRAKEFDWDVSARKVKEILGL